MSHDHRDLRLNYDANKALTEINTQVSSVLNQLPPQAQQPVLTVQVGQTIDAMYMGFDSDVLPTNKITDYLVARRQAQAGCDPGVQTAELLGGAISRCARGSIPTSSPRTA